MGKKILSETQYYMASAKVEELVLLIQYLYWTKSFHMKNKRHTCLLITCFVDLVFDSVNLNLHIACNGQNFLKFHCSLSSEMLATHAPEKLPKCKI